MLAFSLCVWTLCLLYSYVFIEMKFDVKYLITFALGLGLGIVFNLLVRLFL